MRGRKQTRARKVVAEAAPRPVRMSLVEQEGLKSTNEALRQQVNGIVECSQMWERRAKLAVERLTRAERDFQTSQDALRESRYQQARLVTRVEALEHALVLQHSQVKETLDALGKFSDGATKVAAADAILSNPHNTPTRIEFKHDGESWQHRMEHRG